jgi:hypothetical protein
VPPAGLLDNGVYNVVAYATDAAGNRGVSAIRSFTLSSDFTAPSISISEPLAGSTVHFFNFGRGTINGEATDNIGVTSVKVKLVRKRVRNSVSVTEFWNGTAFSTTSAMVDANLLDASVSSVGYPNALWSLDDAAPTISDLDQGVYTVYAYAYDAAGNSKAATAHSFTVTGNIINGAPASSAGGS